LVFVDGQPYGFEVKRTSAPKITPSMKNSLNDLSLKKLFVIHAGDHEFDLNENIRAIPSNQIHQLSITHLL
jgi:predicted AAA+ superfamily ATPase